MTFPSQDELMTPLVDPDAQAFMALMAAKGVPPTYQQSLTQARQFYRERCVFTQPPAPPMALVQDLSVGGVPCRLYRPEGSRAEQRLPVLVYFHGGGWTIGDLDTHDVLCRQLAQAAGVAVVATDYRLGPEHRFPAAVDDCVAAVQGVRAQAAELGVDAQRLVVGGDSAGGNLAAVVCLALREAGADQPQGQVLIYPATDMRALAPSHTTNGQGYMFTRDSVAFYRDKYMADPAQWSDWRASPLLAPSHAGLAPALVLTAGFDPLRDEGLQYANALSRAGVPTQYLCFERQIHGFVAMSGVIQEAHTAVSVCAETLRRWVA